MHWFWYGTSGWMAWMMAVTMVAFWGLAVLGIAALVRYLIKVGTPRDTTAPRITAEEILADRFARGDIDATEYQHDLDVLRGAHPTDKA